MWSTVLTELERLYPAHACAEYLRCYPLFSFRPDQVGWGCSTFCADVSCVCLSVPCALATAACNVQSAARWQAVGTFLRFHVRLGRVGQPVHAAQEDYVCANCSTVCSKHATGPS